MILAIITLIGSIILETTLYILKIQKGESIEKIKVI